MCLRDGQRWVMAVYFPRGQRGYSEIEEKFRSDLAKAAENAGSGLAFVTNQELRLSERKSLADIASTMQVELFHLERLTAILDKPSMAGVRQLFLAIDPSRNRVAEEIRSVRNEMAALEKRLTGIQTGGDSFCYWMLYHFNTQENLAYNFALIRKGEFPLFDVRIRIRDMDLGKDVVTKDWGEINSPADYLMVAWPLRDSLYYRVFFHARNGSWHQDLLLRKLNSQGYWAAATRVVGPKGDILFEHTDDPEYSDHFGRPDWRS